MEANESNSCRQRFFGLTSVNGLQYTVRRCDVTVVHMVELNQGRLKRSGGGDKVDKTC